MKVLMVNVVCGIRSTGRICTDLAQELESQGHVVKIAYGRDRVPEQYQKYAVRIGTDLNVKIAGAEARLFDNAGFSNKKSTEKFVQWVEQYNPDIIHLHNLHGYYINIEIFFKYLRNCGKKIIWTLHDCWAFTGHSAYCEAVNCTRWEKGCFKCLQINHYPKSYIDHSKQNWLKKREIFRNIDNLTIVTPSNWLAGLVQKSFLRDYPIYVINNGIDTQKFKPLQNDFRQTHNIDNKFIILGVATTWNDLKELSDFIKLAEILDSSYQIVLVGLKKNQIKKLPKYILGIERTNSIKELTYIYCAADVVVNLTYCDNYPTVDLEAIKCGLPLLTYETGGSTEIIKQYGGYVVERGNIRTVAKKIKEIHMKSDKQNRILNIDYTLDYHTAVNNYIDLYGIKTEKRDLQKNRKTRNNHCVEKGYWKTKKELGLVGNFIILGVAAVWDSRKGLQDFIEIGKKLLPYKDYKIILVGLNKDQQKSIPSNIISIEKTNDVNSLRKIYSIADVFVNTTYEDNYPTVNLEARSCGTNVITYNSGGSSESAGENGIIVKKGDIISVVDMVLSWTEKM